MHSVWPILRLIWSGLIVVYLLLIVIPGHMRSWEKRLNDWLFVTVIVFVWIRIFGRLVFHGGLFFQYSLVVAGFAAAVGIPFRIKALITRYGANSEEPGR